MDCRRALLLVITAVCFACDHSDERAHSCAAVCQALSTCYYLPSALGRDTNHCEQLCSNSAASVEEDPAYAQLRSCITKHSWDCSQIAECAVPPLALDIVGRGSVQLFGWTMRSPPRECSPQQETVDIVTDLCDGESVGAVALRVTARSYASEQVTYKCEDWRRQGVLLADVPAGPGRLVFGLSRTQVSDGDAMETVRECAQLTEDVNVRAGACVAKTIGMPKHVVWTPCENDSVTCHDGMDNDRDGVSDCADPECAREDCPASFGGDASVANSVSPKPP